MFALEERKLVDESNWITRGDEFRVSPTFIAVLQGNPSLLKS